MTKTSAPRFVSAALFVLLAATARAKDWSGGILTAVPVRDGRPPAIDGRLDDWDLSAAEPVILSEQTAAQMHADYALMYDAAALYVGVRVGLPGRPYNNPNNTTDAFWQGDLIQCRFATDPALPYPLDRNRDATSPRIVHVSIWKNSLTGADTVNVAIGTKLNLGQTNNPPGSAVAIRTDGSTGYVVEARLPWAALGVPDGRNPFRPGQKTAFVAETLWTGGDATRIAAFYRTDPGTFAFLNAHTWGEMLFAGRAFGARRRPTIETLVAAPGGATATPAEGVPFAIDVPADGLEVSVNILGPHGEVLRELIGGEPHPKGVLTLRWDGRDAWGHALPPGEYAWGAYFHRPLRIELAGAVGTSGNPTYPTLDGRGGWGGDHSDPLACAADATGSYLLWPQAEQGRAIVKIDSAGRVLWRKTPFVGGGFGPFYAVAADGRRAYLILGDRKVRLVRLDAASGALLTWGAGGPTEMTLLDADLAQVPPEALPLDTRVERVSQRADSRAWPHPHAMGLAVRDGRVFVSAYATNRILVADADSGRIERELACPGPRGLAFDAAGALVAVSYVPGQSARIVRFAAAAGTGTPVVTQGLEAPFGVAVDATGRLYVTDLGRSQQVKVFDAQGAALTAFGRVGGRPWQGRYDGGAFLHPAGVTIEAGGDLLLAESSPPKVVSRLRPSDGYAQARWFGPGAYWNAAWPLPEEPREVFYTLVGAIGRGRVAPPGEQGQAAAYWAPDRAGYPEVEPLDSSIAQLETVRATNGGLYLVHDGGDHAVFWMTNDVLRPVATWRVVTADKRRFPENTLGRPYLQVWCDANGDGRPQPDEETPLTNLADGRPLPQVSDTTASLHMEPNGDLYFMTQGNSILKVPAAGFAGNGMLRWNLAGATLAVPVVLPGLAAMSTCYREGLLGVRVARGGDLYTVFNTDVKGEGGAFDYATPALATRMRSGLGHTSRFNVVKFAKFAPDGRLLWMAGRKATAGARPGEIYHAWNLAGLVNDRYVAAGSEWGVIAFYTHDGFFVDSLMNNPGMAPPPGPYSFSGETAGARVQEFPALDQVWAYCSGMGYEIRGFRHGRIEGEERASGRVTLDRTYASPDDAAAAAARPLALVRLAGNPFEDAAAWRDVPAGEVRREGAVLARAQLGYDDTQLYARIRVADPTPLQNGADVPELAFKGGDTAGIVLGAAEHSQAGAGDVRLLAASVAGQPRLVAMKAVTAGEKKPFDYITGQKAHFDFVGEVPGGRVRLAPDADGNGYTAVFAAPRTFLEFDLKSGAVLRGDVEIRLSGAGSRGLQAMERHYLFTPARPETTMVDDVPTESRLYPEFWGPIEVR